MKKKANKQTFLSDKNHAFFKKRITSVNMIHCNGEYNSHSKDISNGHVWEGVAEIMESSRIKQF